MGCADAECCLHRTEQFFERQLLFEYYAWRTGTDYGCCHEHSIQYHWYHNLAFLGYYRHWRYQSS